jgi:hypothetical protein
LRILTKFDYTGLLEDLRIGAGVKVENMVVVQIGLRRSSQTTIPAELPRGAEMGAAIDDSMRPRFETLKGIQDPRKRVDAIVKLRKELSKSFEIVVESSPEYKALMGWADRLGLRVDQVEVRPTIHEVYLYRDREVLKELQGLMRERGKLREKFSKDPSQLRGRMQFVYPEEFDGDWIRRMGRLLGYPECCIDRYIQDRLNGVSVERRASEQLKEAGDVDPHAYFASHFFPCSPACDNALARGRLYHEGLRKVDERLGAAYEAVLGENLETVRRQPEIIAEFLSRTGSLTS